MEEHKLEKKLEHHEPKQEHHELHEEKHPVHHAYHAHSASKENQKTGGVGAYAFIGLVVLLLVFSLVQTYQIGQLEEKVSSGGLRSVAGAPASSGASAAPAARSAPTMVGGC